ncbi:hypothetical protein CUR178_05768 [Leishmania enriettii]|uniref:Uncharacterized protein n=1 Tax=Leishmania enriettii TaxID=5663 RepID=A0A836HEH1_LEIEN|nr:hypothetical protein CUR178_05768 [Leishmania enriettii]
MYTCTGVTLRTRHRCCSITCESTVSLIPYGITASWCTVVTRRCVPLVRSACTRASPHIPARKFFAPSTHVGWCPGDTITTRPRCHGMCCSTLRRLCRSSSVSRYPNLNSNSDLTLTLTLT